MSSKKYIQVIRSSSGEIKDLCLPDGDIRYRSKFLGAKESSEYFEYFREQCNWSQPQIKLFGQTHPQPRLTAFYAQNKKTYSYSNIKLEPQPFNNVLNEINKRIILLTGIEFTSCLLNLYRSGADSNGWHSDDEKELGENPVIASVSLGQERYFHLRHKFKKELKQKILLENGSLLLMQGTTQHFWQHQIPKTKTLNGPRINLTFRQIK